MSTSETSIANTALLLMGENVISNLDSDISNPAVVMRQFYAQTRDALLRAFPWDFAKLRVQLAHDVSGPVFGWTYKYKLPPDYLRVLLVNDKKTGWVVENGLLLTDEESVNVEYLYRCEDTGKFDSLFVTLLAKRLARETAWAITRSDTTSQRMATMYEDAEVEAFNTGSHEHNLDEEDEDDDLLLNR